MQTGPRVVRLKSVLPLAALESDGEYKALKHDVECEARKYGRVDSVAIPRPVESGEVADGVGNIYVHFADALGAARAQRALQGRLLGSATLEASLEVAGREGAV